MKSLAVQLLDGTEIQLRELRVSSTYEGMPPGTPTREVNEDLIAWQLQAARAAFPGIRVELLAPLEHPLEVNLHPLLGTPALLPAFLCHARFQATSNGGGHRERIFVWYQDQLPMPIADRVIEQLQALAWDTSTANLESAA